MICHACPATLGRNNRTGLCRKCAPSHNVQSAETKAKRVASLKTWAALNPDKVKAKSDRLIAAANTPEQIEARRQRAIRINLNSLGVAASLAPEALARRGASVSATRLKDIAPRHRAQHRHLVRSGKMKAAESRALFAQIEARETAAIRAGAGR